VSCWCMTARATWRTRSMPRRPWWRACDGHTDTHTLAARCHTAHDRVQVILARLDELGLFEGAQADQDGETRRTALRKITIAGAGLATIPTISTILVPTAAQAVSCVMTFTEYAVPTAASNPVGIAAGPDGALWFTENNGNKIGRGDDRLRRRFRHHKASVLVSTPWLWQMTLTCRSTHCHTLQLAVTLRSDTPRVESHLKGKRCLRFRGQSLTSPGVTSFSGVRTSPSLMAQRTARPSGSVCPSQARHSAARVRRTREHGRRQRWLSVDLWRGLRLAGLCLQRGGGVASERCWIDAWLERLGADRAVDVARPSRTGVLEREQRERVRD
jgi:hypothetical protein